MRKYTRSPKSILKRLTNLIYLITCSVQKTTDFEFIQNSTNTQLESPDTAQRRIQEETSEIETPTFVNKVLVEMQPFTTCLTMIDLRHLSLYNDRFFYQRDWIAKVIFNTTERVYVVDFGLKMPPPSGFVNKTQSPYIFSFMAVDEGTLEVIFEVRNQSFSLQYLATLDITTFEILKPNRAILGTTKTWITTISNGNGGYILPGNLLLMENEEGGYSQPPFLISEANIFDLNVQRGIKSTINRRRIMQDDGNTAESPPDPVTEDPDSIKFADIEEIADPFAPGQSFIPMLYLPFISNCEYFGSKLFLSTILESHPDCLIKNRSSIVPIKNLGFGQIATADICSNLRFNCKYEANVTDTSKNYWFRAKSSEEIFYFYEDPVSFEELKGRLDGMTAISTEFFVPVTVDVESLSQGEKIPTEVKLDLGYYQQDATTKKLIKSQVKFSGFINPSNYTSSDYNYTLIFSFVPLTHTELLIEFALPWFVYLIMYILVCLLTIIMTAVFMLFHKLVSRYKTSFYFFPYLKVFLPPSLYGLLYVVVPQIVYVLIIAVLFTHHIMDIKFQGIFCDDLDLVCMNGTIWDNFYLTDFDEEKRTKIQYARVGFLLTHYGLWIHWRTAQLCEPDKTKEEKAKKAEAYDGNVWYKTNWKRMNYFTMSMILVLFQIFHVHFSFTNRFSGNIWVYIVVFKILGITVENICEVFMEDKLMMCPISSTIPLMENLATFGADDFSDFILSYVWGFGMMLIERSYVIPSTDIIVDWTLGKIEKLRNFVKKTFGKQDDEDEEEEEDETGDLEDKTKKSIVDDDGAGSKADSKGSDILITENSFENELFEKFKNFADPVLYYKNEQEIDISESEKEYSLKLERHKTDKSKIKKVKTKFLAIKELDDSFELLLKNKIENQDKIRGTRKKEEEKKEEKESPVFEVDSDENLESYYNYAVEIVSFFYMPFINLLIWQFYHETAVSEKWGIRKKDFLFYFLFSTIIIPFQIPIDILFFNLMSYYLNFDYLNSLKKWSKEFKESKKLWRGLNDIKIDLDYKLRRLEQLKFSSQFYFVAYLGSSGHLILIVGIMTIIQSSLYPWDDNLIVFILVLNHVIILLVEYMTLKVRKWLGIWEIEKEIIKNRRKVGFGDEEEDSDFDEKNEQLYEEVKNFDENLEIRNLKMIDSMREKEMRFKSIIKNMNKSNFGSAEYREEFINANEQWLNDRIKTVLSPRTLYKHRKKLLKILTSIRGEAKPINENRHKFEQQSGMYLDMKEKESLKESLKPYFLKIFKVWLTRARRIKYVRSQVAGVLELMTRPFCEFCGVNWGLKCETIENIEFTFHNFLLEKQRKGLLKGKLEWELLDWQNYFVENSTFRTCCYSCYEEISPGIKTKMRYFHQPCGVGTRFGNTGARFS